jgi:hypothetical protein
MSTRIWSFLVRAMVLTGASVAATTVLASVPAGATDCTSNPLTGTYKAFSDGQWAQTRQSYHDEISVTATWTITTTCADFFDCTGQVASDQGWTAPIRCGSGQWKVDHEVPGWEPCADGTAATGRQVFLFSSDTETTFTGQDKTVGPSGACGVNYWQTVAMPFTLTKLE